MNTIYWDKMALPSLAKHAAKECIGRFPLEELTATHLIVTGSDLRRPHRKPGATCR